MCVVFIEVDQARISCIVNDHVLGSKISMRYTCTMQIEEDVPYMKPAAGLSLGSCKDWSWLAHRDLTGRSNHSPDNARPLYTVNMAATGTFDSGRKPLQ